MDKLKRIRATHRTAFSRTLGLLNIELEKRIPDSISAQATLAVLEGRMREMEEVNNKILDCMLEADVSDENLNKELEGSDEYKTKFETVKRHTAMLLTPPPPSVPRNPTNATSSNDVVNNSRKFKLPKVECKKFNGEPKEWLRFWSFFRKIHEDTEIDLEEKFDFLLQSMVEGSRASEYVNSFPPTAENYPKVIDGLKGRFGRKDLLVEVYMRELLKLVLDKSEKPLISIYDRLETQLRSLESLNVETETCAAMLLPLVESSLTEEILRAWTRRGDTGDGAQERLKSLMSFLESEVRNEERIQMAKDGFGSHNTVHGEIPTVGKVEKKVRHNGKANANVATAAGLLAAKESHTTKCIFCQASHENSSCEKAKRMSFEEKQNIAKEKKACFLCLKLNHTAQWCRYKNKCSSCHRKHVTLMCKNVPKNNNHSDKEEKTSKEIENLTLSYNNASSNTDVCLQTLRIQLRGPGGECVVRALIDPGSHKTYVLGSVADKIRLPVVGQQTMVHLLFGGRKSDPQCHEKYEVFLSSMDGKYECFTTAFREEVICQSLPSVTSGSWIQTLQDQNICLSDPVENNETISFLIGADIAGRLYTGKLLQLKNGPTALQTKLGWTLMGRNNSEGVADENAALTVLSMFVRENQISDLWDLDVLGICDPTLVVSKEAHLQEVKERFQATIKVNTAGRYQVTLPWKDNHPPLSNNSRAAIKRLYGLTKKLIQDGLYDIYDEVFRQWQREGIIEMVSTYNEENGYFLPHRHVVKLNSTTPIRPVFDASASSGDGPSLNQCLETGPNLIELIPNILCRFRENKIGVAADITKAFLQISVDPQDRDALKFLWWSDSKHRQMVVYQHQRVVFGINSSPFLLGATIEHLLEKALDSAVTSDESCMLSKLKRSFYVDNCITSVEGPEELLKFKEHSTEVMKRAGFELRGWESTDSRDQKETTSLLGICWNKTEDFLFISINDSGELNGPITKRKILSAMNRIFDPLGWVSPVSLLPKRILQDLWSLKIKWDDEVPFEITIKFKNWVNELSVLQQLRVPRWIFGEKENNVTLHMFVDASKGAYAAVLFVRVENSHAVEVHLVQAKCKVAPTKEVSIPRMELLAATIGARLMDSFVKGMDYSHVRKTFWSDSSTVLSWLRLGKNWTTFIRNRVEEIKNLSNVESWRHVPGKMNPADLPSRGCSALQLVQSKWWLGPEWLKRPAADWPNEKFTINDEEVNAEICKSSREENVGRKARRTSDILMTTTGVNISHGEENAHWYLFNSSSYERIVRIMVWMLRFVNNLKAPRTLRVKSDVSLLEISLAEKTLIRFAQNDSFKGVMDARLKGLNVYLEDGIIKTKTLISNREDTMEFKHPAILDPSHPLTRLLIEDTHRRIKHAGASTTMAVLREKFWIISSRRAVRSVINKCVTCRRYTAKSLDTTPASLPINRVRDAAVFEVVGVDYAGPLYLKDGTKAWVCLYTCAVYRAIHLELVTSLSTQGFIETFRRFVARRGRPTTVYSDNGTNFVGTNTLLKSIDWQKVKSHCLLERIQWNFNPPSAPWWGGWWERLIRIVKDLLKRTLGKASLSYEELVTVLCECEAIVNARPITYFSDDTDGLTVITPEMFLKDIRTDIVPDLDYLEKTSLNRRIRYKQRLRQELKIRFRSEYLGQLTRHVKIKRMNSEIHEGDIVLVSNDNQKRLDWPLAMVLKTIKGNDGVTRIARVKTATGEIIRPLQRLVPLEDPPERKIEPSLSTVESSTYTRSQQNSPINQEASVSDSATDQRKSSRNSNISTRKSLSRRQEKDLLVEKKTRCGRVIQLPKKLSHDYV